MKTFISFGALIAPCVFATPAFAATVTFNEFPVGTSITTQYQPQGVVFDTSVFITEDSANPSSPVLSGSPRFVGPIAAHFVNPKSGKPLTATNVSFSAGFFDATGSTAVTWFDAAGTVLGTVTNSGQGILQFTAPDGVARFSVAAAGSEPAGFAIDNLSFTLSPFAITRPTASEVFSFNATNFTAVDAKFTTTPSDTKQVQWTAERQYQTSGGRGAVQDSVSFKSAAGSETSRTYTAKGGRIVVKASATIGGISVEADPVTFVVAGSALPDSVITDKLVSLYGGATPRLLTGIAQTESTYRQFATSKLFGISAMWPVESFDGGSHIGLMQMPTAENPEFAWSWLVNAESAARLFGDKLATAGRLERRIIQANQGLRTLAAEERENMALCLYGPGAMAGLSNQYYRAVTTPTGPVWVVNTDNNATCVNYANTVRSNIR